MTFVYFFALTLFILLCFLLSGVILMQEGKSSGLGSSFGGETRESMFGTSTADVLRKFTAWLAFIFLLSCVLLSLWTSAMGRTKINIPTFETERVE